MKDQRKYADTVSVFNLFKFIISLNQYRFIYHTADDVVEMLLYFTNLDSLYYSKQVYGELYVQRHEMETCYFV